MRVAWLDWLGKSTRSETCKVVERCWLRLFRLGLDLTCLSLEKSMGHVSDVPKPTTPCQQLGWEGKASFFGPTRTYIVRVGT